MNVLWNSVFQWLYQDSKKTRIGGLIIKQLDFIGHWGFIRHVSVLWFDHHPKPSSLEMRHPQNPTFSCFFVELAPSKLTVRPWKSPMFNGFTSLPTPMTAKVYVNIPEGMFNWDFYQALQDNTDNNRIQLQESPKSHPYIRNQPRSTWGGIGNVPSGNQLGG